MLWDLDIGQVGPEITVRATQRIELAGVIVHRSSRTWGATHRAGVPTTEPLRLLMELGSQTTAAELEAAVDQLVERRLVTWATVERTRASESRQGRRGLGAIGRLLEDRITRLGPTDSKLEADFARLLRRAHLHEAVLHPTIRIGARTIVPDFAFLAERVLIELDGFAFHGDRAAFERDRDRDVIAAADGWLVLRFTWRQVGEQPGEVIARIRAVLASRRELRSHATA
jgi:very-short-patch-repair endonuclease